MELLFNYYHGLLTQQQTVKNENNIFNSNTNNRQYNETPQQILTPEFLAHFFSLLASLNYLEQFKSEENRFNNASPINQPIIATSPYQIPIGSIQRHDDALATIKCEPNEVNCIEYNEKKEVISNISHNFFNKSDNQIHIDETIQEDDRPSYKNNEKKCKKLKGKESSKRYREKMRSQNMLMEKELNEKEKLNEKLSAKINLLKDLKDKLCMYGQELCRMHDFQRNELKVTNETSSPTV